VGQLQCIWLFRDLAWGLGMSWEQELARTIGKVFGKSVPIEIVDTGTEYYKGFRHLDIQKARTVWNWHPRSLEEGLKLMFAQMSKEKSGKFIHEI